MKDMVSVCEDAKYLLLQISSLGLDSQMKDMISSVVGNLNRSIEEHEFKSKIDVTDYKWTEKLQRCPDGLKQRAAEIYVSLDKATDALFDAQEKFDGHKKSPLIGQADTLYLMRLNINNIKICVMNGNLV